MSRVAVLGSSNLVRPAAAALALRVTGRGAAGLVCMRGVTSSAAAGGDTAFHPDEPVIGDELGSSSGPPVISPPPIPVAARLGAQLRSNGHPGRASWRLVTSYVSTAAEASAVLSILDQKLTCAVLCLEGPVSETSLKLLTNCDLAVIALAAGVPEGLATMAVESAEEKGCASRVERFDPPGLASVLPLAGIAVPPMWSDPILACSDWIAELQV